MHFDQWGRPILAPGQVPQQAAQPQFAGVPGYGQTIPQGTPVPGGALIHMPNAAELGGQNPAYPAFYRNPFFPTAPFYSTNPNVGYQTRFYSAGIANTAADQEQVVAVQFDLPCRLIAINGASFTTEDPWTFPAGLGPRDTFLFRLEYTTGDKLHISQRLASTVVGSAERPGELGGTGYTIDQGATVLLGITPLLANLRIDITLVCLEMRGARNYQAAPGR